MFSELKLSFKGRQFVSLEGISMNVMTLFKQLPVHHFQQSSGMSERGSECTRSEGRNSEDALSPT
jgi:hypothetical protein